MPKPRPDASEREREKSHGASSGSRVDRGAGDDPLAGSPLPASTPAERESTCTCEVIRGGERPFTVPSNDCPQHGIRPERERVPTVEELIEQAKEVYPEKDRPFALKTAMVVHLAERLHAALARVAELEPWVCIHSVPPPDLVAEIERLRAEVGEHMAYGVRLRQNYENLRAGLREIEEADTDWHVGIAENVERLQAIARRLLGEEK